MPGLSSTVSPDTQTAAMQAPPAIKAVLISESGTAQTIWLPHAAGGRHRFTPRPDMPPVYFESEDGQWIVYCEKNVSFYGRDSQGQVQTKSRLPLGHECVARILWHDGKYVLYAELDREGDSVFLPYRFEESEFVIGREPPAQICYANRTVSREHARLYWENGSWWIKDLNSTNGTYVNGRKVALQQLGVGDVIYIKGLYLLIGPGFISVNNQNNRVQFRTSKIHPITSADTLNYAPCPEGPQSSPLFDRQPRRRRLLEPEPITFDMPPMPLTGSKIPFLLRMGSPMVMGGRALFTGNILMALTSLVFPGLTQGLTEKEQKEYEEKRLTTYRGYLEEKAKQIRDEKTTEEFQLNECYPELSAALRFATEKDRLWERRCVDEDFLTLRVGTGQRPLAAELDYPKQGFEIERDVLKEEMYALAQKPVVLEHVPIMLSLKTDYVVGVLGFSKDSLQAIRGLVMQLVLTHSCDEVKLVVLAGEEYAAEFDFARYLPHTWSDDRSIRFFAVNLSDALEIGEFLNGEIEAALESSENGNRQSGLPAYVIAALDKKLFDSIECLKKVLYHGEYCGVSVLAAFDGVPKECTQLIDLRAKPKLVSLAGAETENQAFQVERFSPPLARKAMSELMRTKLATSSEAYTLPGMITFMEMFEAGRVEHLNPLRRWSENNPVKSLAVPIGVGVDGRPFTLDLHEKRQGPHGLVAGMTGSGKSEFIITYILSMAVNFSPDEVAFILIDYKGGGLADAFENEDRGIHLPHLVGTITNLDGAAIDRSLASIKSELTHRQAVFKETKARLGESTLDIYDYQKLYRNKQVDEPLPHLFIISDEFAELKQQQPMFMDELISAARIGRSLGVHLILATQKPGGVVNNQIWSNTKFRACLRVQDRSDSMEMLKRPEAAELKQTGRFYLQVGYDEYFALGQSAWCGADYCPQDKVIEEVDNSVHFLDNVGQSILTLKPAVEKRASQGRQVTAIVKYLSDLAREQGIEPKKLWKPPLPKKLELETMLQTETPPAELGIPVLLGLVDDPEYQRQFPLYVDLLGLHNFLIVGGAGSGKSTLVRTLLYSLVYRYSPEDVNFYLVDLSDQALMAYSQLPHCGAYLTERQTSELPRLMEIIHQIIAQRKALFAEAGVSSFDAYRAIRPLPLILFVIDGYTKIKGLEGGESFFIKFPEYLREGTSVGFRFVVSCNHLPEVGSQSKQEFDGRIALLAKDHYEYSDILSVRCKNAPPEITGRGMCAQDGRSMVYQAAMLDCEKGEQERTELLNQRLTAIAARDQGAVPALHLPMIDPEQPYEEFCASFQRERIPLGYSARDMKPVSIPFQQLYCMSLYFGNPKGVKPILGNLLTAARMNAMDTIVIRRTADSVFDGASDQSVRYLESTAEGLGALAEVLLSEFKARCAFRDEYSVQQGIPLTAKGRAKKAAKYIRAHSKPLLVLIESFADFCAVEETNGDGELQGQFMAFFSAMQGYNFYFAAGFYPSDPSLAKHPLMQQYNQEEFLLLSGGRYDRGAIPDIPYEIKKADKMDPVYNRVLMKYQETFYPLIMPCGKPQKDGLDPDEAPII